MRIATQNAHLAHNSDVLLVCTIHILKDGMKTFRMRYYTTILSLFDFLSTWRTQIRIATQKCAPRAQYRCVFSLHHSYIKRRHESHSNEVLYDYIQLIWFFKYLTHANTHRDAFCAPCAKSRGSVSWHHSDMNIRGSKDSKTAFTSSACFFKGV